MAGGCECVGHCVTVSLPSVHTGVESRNLSFHEVLPRVVAVITDCFKCVETLMEVTLHLFLHFAYPVMNVFDE